eukprot:6206576-Pleurochrysis_carterae.AAC.1
MGLASCMRGLAEDGRSGGEGRGRVGLALHRNETLRGAILLTSPVPVQFGVTASSRRGAPRPAQSSLRIAIIIHVLRAFAASSSGQNLIEYNNHQAPCKRVLLLASTLAQPSYNNHCLDWLQHAQGRVPDMATSAGTCSVLPQAL